MLNSKEFPLIQEYFGGYLEVLIQHRSAGEFIEVLNNPFRLERRLAKLTPQLIKAIVREIGEHHSNIDMLDKRLMDAWAELRVVSQLVKEGFQEIQKYKTIVDLVARFSDQEYAFQVTRINRSLQDKFIKYNSPDAEDEPYGEISDIYNRYQKPLSYLFWDTIQDKNGEFGKWRNQNSIRCIVLVSNEENLQDNFIKHIACREIYRGVKLLSIRRFDELLWLPDLTNGAWFRFGKNLQETKCLVDWCNGLPFDECENSINRKEVNLSSLLPN